jgi:chloramphenicol 3-O-phosphotransferase
LVVTGLFLALVSGPPAAGKNAVVARIRDLFEETLASIDIDQVKEFVTPEPRIEPFLDLAARLTRLMTREYLHANVSVVVHNAFCDYGYVRPFLAVAEELRVPSWYFKLTAPLEELLRRNATRERACPEADVRRIYAAAEQCAHEQGIVIDTTRSDTDATARLILRTISSASSGR